MSGSTVVCELGAAPDADCRPRTDLTVVAERDWDHRVMGLECTVLEVNIVYAGGRRDRVHRTERGLSADMTAGREMFAPDRDEIASRTDDWRGWRLYHARKKGH